MDMQTRSVPLRCLCQVVSTGDFISFLENNRCTERLQGGLLATRMGTNCVQMVCKYVYTVWFFGNCRYNASQWICKILFFLLKNPHLHL